jgi:CBS domain-containing protein
MSIKTPDESPQATLPLNPDEEQAFPPGRTVPIGQTLDSVAPVRNVLVRDVMTRKVFTTFPGATLLDAALEMHHHHVTGLPVIGPDERVAGVVTETDVMRVLGVGPETGTLGLILPVGQGRTEPVPIHELKEVQEHLRATRVSDAMTPDPVVIRPDQTIEEASRLLLSEKVNRLPVVENDRLIGILTRHDVLRAIPPRSAL